MCLATVVLATMAAVAQPVHAADGGQMKFKRISTQYIAALGDPGATSGSGAQSWGLWPLDPDPRGVELESAMGLDRLAKRMNLESMARCPNQP